MRVPCPVPLQSPWSPAGYRVVEVADEPGRQTEGGPRAGQPDGEGRAPRRPSFPSSPVGYRVVQVADERSPEPRRSAPPPPRHQWDEPLPRRRWEEPPPRTANLGVLCGVTAGGVFLLVLLTSWVGSLSASASSSRQVDVAFVDEQGPQVVIPQPVPALPDAGVAGEPAPAAPVVKVNLPDAAAPAAQEKDRPAAPGFPAQDGGQPGAGAAPAGCENFGTAVAFARDPLEAARLAGKDGKLTFLLHVSGNFEDAGFT